MKYIVTCCAALVFVSAAFAQVGEETLKGIMTPNRVETSIGTLEFNDGAPLPETVEKVYDYLDRMRGVDAFLKGLPITSSHALHSGAAKAGADEAHQVLIYDKMMDSSSLFLTANTSTFYTWPTLDLLRDGPTVVDLPAGLLGVVDNAAFHFVADLGPFGQDKGKGGKYLFLPPGYEGEVPEGYFVVRTKTYDHIFVVRGSMANGLEAANKHMRTLRIYPLSKAANPPEMEFISGSDDPANTIHSMGEHRVMDSNPID